jgi:hypothetical protein
MMKRNKRLNPLMYDLTYLIGNYLFNMIKNWNAVINFA